METAIVSIICIALIIFGGMTMSNGFISNMDAGTAGLEQAGNRNEMIMRTELMPVSTNITLVAGPTPLEVVLQNTGQTKAADFEKWDIIVQYYDNSGGYHVVWLPYSNTGGGTNEWGVGWIHINGQPEMIEPNVLNPGEQIMLQTWLDPEVGSGTTNMITVSTPSGVTSTTYFSP
jgi:hypothetical protein